MKDRSKLTTEKSNQSTVDIDRLSTLKIVELINQQDALVVKAAAGQKRQVAKAIDIVTEAFNVGGRLFYVGAGTSGRLGVLDASECPPTFGVRPAMVQGVIAGGKRALVRSIEGAEDSKQAGRDALIKRKIKSVDVVMGIAACGITPFVHGAIQYARSKGCKTIFLTCAPQAKKSINTDVIINPVVGPEVITGSTRMKAGTVTKLVLNTITTAAMIKTGKVYGNLMVDLRATNRKLQDRAERILISVTGRPKASAKRLLKKANGRVKAAIVMHFRKVDLPEAIKILKECGQSLRGAIKEKCLDN